MLGAGMTDKPETTHANEPSTDMIDGALESLTQEKAVFILKLLHHGDQISRLTMLKAIDLANSLKWFS